MYVKVYMSEPERDTLLQLAGRKGIALSQLIYTQLLPLLHNELTNLLAFDSLQEEDNTPVCQTLTLHLTQAEYDLLQHQAKGTPLSVYVRYLIFSRHLPATVEIASDDIDALNLKVSTYIEQLQNFIAALYIRNELYDADRNRLMQIASNT